MRGATHLAATIGERAAGTPGEAAAGAWIAETLDAYGYQVMLQPFPIARFTVPFTATNVIAVKPGLPGYGTLYLGAHYDTIYRPTPDWPIGGPGANDNASGVAVLLEAARVLAGESFSPTLVLVAFSAEEMGLLGSAHYIAQLPLQDGLTADGMINLDCVGLGSRLGLFIRRPIDQPFADRLGVAADMTGIDVNAMSDHVPFTDAGIPAVFLNSSDSNVPSCGPWYHLPTDTIDTLQVAAVGRTGTAVVDAVRAAAASAQPQPAVFLYLPLTMQHAP